MTSWTSSGSHISHLWLNAIWVSHFRLLWWMVDAAIAAFLLLGFSSRSRWVGVLGSTD